MADPVENAFLQQKSIDNKIDFDQTMNALSILGIRGSSSYIESVFYELDVDGIGKIDIKSFINLVQQLQKVKAAQHTDDDQSDEETVSLINHDKAKAFDKIVSIAQVNGSITITLDDIEKILKDITGN